MITNLKKMFLEQFPNTLTEKDKADIEEYNQAKATDNKKAVAYFKSLEDQGQKNIEFTFEEIEAAFYPKFKEVYGNEFIKNKETEANLKTLLYYFAKDERFLQSPLIYNDANLDKGLLLIGDYGTGKSVCMKVIHLLLKGAKGHTFGYISTNEVVNHYENCTDPQDKQQFWYTNNTGKRYFDDIKTEQMANNYGKKNIMKDLIERRYENKITTFASCNFKGDSKDMSLAIQEFKELYGGRVYDRLFEMFNIIEWRGGSFRK